MTHLSRKIKIILINSEEYEIEIPNNITNYWEIRKYLRNELKRFGFKPDLISLYENEKNNWTLIIHITDVTHQIHYQSRWLFLTLIKHIQENSFNQKIYLTDINFYMPFKLIECNEDKYSELEKLKYIQSDLDNLKQENIEKIEKYLDALEKWCY